MYEEANGLKQGSWFRKTQGPDYRRQMFSLCFAMIGIGYITLPNIGKENGLFPMIFLIVFTGLMSYVSSVQLGRGYTFSGGQTYSKIVGKVVNRSSSLVILVCLYFYITVSAGTYYVFGNCCSHRRLLRLELPHQPQHRP